MTFKETSFRAFYKKFTVFMFTDTLRKVTKNLPAAEQGNCILTYGYIDRSAGLTLEILAVGVAEKDSVTFFSGTDTCRSFLRIGAVMEQEFFALGDEDGSLYAEHASEIERLHHYDASEEVELTRQMEFLDASRDSACIDDVLVYLFKEGLSPEGCWVRITGLEEQSLKGTLLNEPDQDFGCHRGEELSFFVQQNQDQRFFCVCVLPTK